MPGRGVEAGALRVEEYYYYYCYVVVPLAPSASEGTEPKSVSQLGVSHLGLCTRTRPAPRLPSSVIASWAEPRSLGLGFHHDFCKPSSTLELCFKWRN